jgi:hypothetical protein
MMSEQSIKTAGQCGSCRHFRNDAKFLEGAFPGLTSMSSGYGSARSDDGICLRHDRYLGARCSCAEFSPAAAAPDRCDELRDGPIS